MDEEKLIDHHDRLYNAAMEYYDRGWSFIPCEPEGKIPLIKWRDYQLVQPSEELVHDWFENGVRQENGNIAHDFDLLLITGRTSGVVVVDCDNEQAVQEAKKLGLDSNVAVQTRKGIHYYWEHDGGDRHPNKVGSNVSKHDFSWPSVEGLDFRGDGGVAVLPPSRRKDGKTYEWLNDFDDLSREKIWQSRNFLKDVTEASDEDIKQMLAANKIPSLANDVADELKPATARDQVIADGGVIATGGRNAALTKYVGKLLAEGCDPRDLVEEATKLVDEFMPDPLSEREIFVIVNSVVDKDRRDKPWRYDDEGHLINTKTEKQEVAVEIPMQPLVTRANAEEIRKKLGKERYLMYPAIQHPTIAQVYGYSGHGKSLFVGHLMYALACGKDFAAYENMQKGRVLYLDFENGLGEITDRIDRFHETFGRPADDEGFAVYSPANKEASVLDMRSEDGLKEVIANARGHNADVIVIDTLRTAFSGFDENRSQDWAVVNHVLLSLRNAGFSVIGVHHANKPQQASGSSSPTSGSEAGSTNQLTLLETQMRVTQIFPDTDEGRLRAEEVRGVVDEAGWKTLDDMRTRREDRDKEGYRIVTAVRVSYGKVRARTEAHKTCYIGFGEAQDGKPVIISTTPIRQRVKWASQNGGETGDGYPLDVIAREYGVSVRQIREWI